MAQTRPPGHFSKNHSRSSANGLVPTLFLSFGARCRSGARGHGLFEARLLRARPLEVRRAIETDRSFDRQLWRPLIAGATCPATDTMIHGLLPCLEPPSRLPSTRTATLRNRASYSLSKHITHTHSTLRAPRIPSPTNAPKRRSGAFATTHVPQVVSSRTPRLERALSSGAILPKEREKKCT